MLKQKPSLFSLSLLALVACGPTQEPTKISGQVIDGYVSGATVFLDLNYNAQLDANEPMAISGSNGRYELELTDNENTCLGFAPIVVDVPVGAIDEDLGPVTQAYAMTLPPKFTLIDSETNFHITPLTSILWHSMQSEIKQTLNCDIVKEDEALQEKFSAILSNSIANAVHHYNMSEQRIFADFVASGDIEASDIAQNIVRGLKQSIVETLDLKQQYPDAIIAQVNYLQSDSRDKSEDDYTDAWYRETILKTDSIDRSELVKVSEDLTTVIRTIIYGNKTTQHYSSGTVTESFEFESRHGDDSKYTCDVKETLRTTADDIEYELVNLSDGEPTTYDDCVITDFSEKLVGRYSFINFQKDGTQYTTQYHYPATSTFPYLDSWVNLNSNAPYLDFDLLAPTLNGLSYQFDDTETGTADWWVKTKTFMDGEQRHTVSKKHDGTWQRTITFVNGEATKECSTDGVQWQDCVSTP